MLKVHVFLPGGQKSSFSYNKFIDKWVTCRKCEKLPFEKARKGTKRHERAQVGRHILSEYAPNHAWRTKGGISGKSHIRKWAICRKNENFTVWKCARMHERAPRGRFLLSEYAPNHAWHTKGGINGKSHIRKCIICRKKWTFYCLKMHEKAPGGQKSNFPILRVSRNAPLSGGGRSRMKIF